MGLALEAKRLRRWRPKVGDLWRLRIALLPSGKVVVLPPPPSR
jgi:hypothetical protein